MTQKAIVTKIIDVEKAEISVTRVSACAGSCASCGSVCSGQNKITVTAANKVRASVGERVTVESRSGRIIGAAALIYILPLVFFFAGYAASAALSLSESLCVLSSLGAFFLGLGTVVLINRRRKPHRAITFEIVAIE